MLTRAAADLGITLERSFVVGDRWNDLEAGQTVGAQGLLVRTGYGRIDETSPKPGVRPAAVVDNLIAAASWILHAS
jgi:histidinol phosphatase-like enzyme